MDKTKRKKCIYLLVISAVFVIFTVGLMSYDVKEIGPMTSSVGFAKFNGLMHRLIGINMFYYEITDWLGLIPVFIGLIFAFIGLFQLIQRKCIKKVDQKIIGLGIYYILLIIVYIFFETFVVNYRPILIDGFLEPSYPSTHIMISLCVMIPTYLMVKELIQSRRIKTFINMSLILTLVIIVFGRILSGVHWMTDIIGGLLLSGILISIFLTFVPYKNKNIS